MVLWGIDGLHRVVARGVWHDELRGLMQLVEDMLAGCESS